MNYWIYHLCPSGESANGPMPRVKIRSILSNFTQDYLLCALFVLVFLCQFLYCSVSTTHLKPAAHESYLLS